MLQQHVDKAVAVTPPPPPPRACAVPTCHKVYREQVHDRIMMMTPPGHSRYFIAKGRPKTPAPTMAVVLWNALYHLHLFAQRMSKALRMTHKDDSCDYFQKRHQQ